MISNKGSLNLSPFMVYDMVVPKDNLLRQIYELVDFFCALKIENIKSIFNVSDIDVVERSKYDMSFNCFLDIAPEASVIDPSYLTKFRKLRL